MNLGKPASHLLVFIAGGLVTMGALKWSGSTVATNEDYSASIKPVRASDPARIGTWRASPEPLLADRVDASVAESGGIEGAVEVPLEVLGRLSQARGMRRLEQPILDGDDPVEAALNLTVREKELIQSRWEALRSQLVSHETNSVRSIDLEDGSVQLKLPDLSNERRRLAEEYGGFLEKTLGGDRGSAFRAIKQIDHMLTSNSGERTIVVQVESVGDGLWGYRMTLEDDSGTRIWVGDRIPDEIRHLADAAEIFPTITDAVGGDQVE